MSEDIDYAARVQRGIALLDEKWPEWATEIDLEKLDIMSASRCVTAQYADAHDEEDSYEVGMKMLHLNEDAYVEHGFNSESGRGSEYDTLNGLWKAEIERRRAQGQDAPAEPEATS